MVCIYCGSPTKVTNSRAQKRTNQIWRRRQCLSCTANFTTHEITDLSNAIMVCGSPKDLVPFSRDQLFISIYDSLRHRPDALSDATAITQTVIAQLMPQVTKGRLEHQTLITTAQVVLERFDPTAGAVYSAYHKVQKKS